MDLSALAVVGNSILYGTLFRLGGAEVSAMSLLVAALIVAAGIAASRILQRVLRSQIGSRVPLDHGVGYALLRMLHYAIVAAALLVAFQSVGINMTSLTVLGGFFGVGLGFGLQNVTSNFISGLILLLEQPIRVRDKVTVGEHIGTVKEIGMRSTTIDTFDNVRLILPNSMFVEKEVINWSHGDPRIRIHVPFGVAYGSDVPKLRETIRAVADASGDILGAPAPELRFLGFGDSSLDFELLVWITDPLEQFRVKSSLYYAIEAALRQAGIEIPFPQRDLHIRSAAGLRGWAPDS